MSSRQRGASQQAAGAGGAVLLSAALQQEMLDLTERLMEEVARTVSERMLEEVDERARKGAERETNTLEQSVLSVQAKATALQANVESKLQSADERMSNAQRTMRSLEERLHNVERAHAQRVNEREITTAELRSRLESVEASLERALGTMMPKVEALMEQLEAP